MVAPLGADQVLSWGRCHRFEQTRVIPGSIDEAREAIRGAGPVLPYGLGRSYGDSCLNDNAVLVDTARLDHFVSFDAKKGELVCESGASLASILELLWSTGKGLWFLPVVPGTKFVTVGGAIANDVHGKNHELQGTFGRHVKWFDLARSNGKVVRCSSAENEELFRATIGGLGLTGLITRASLSLMKVPGRAMDAEDIRIRNIDHYYDVAEESRTDGWTHHAAWVDVLAGGNAIGRGIYTRSRFTDCNAPKRKKDGGPTFPIDAPGWAVGHPSIKLFNAVYGRKLLGDFRRSECSGYEPILFPLDGIRDWNRLYGKSGFYQYQCVIPADRARSAIRALLEAIAEDGQGSFLTVLKEFGEIESPGLLSFPLRGTTLAVDFPNRGERTLKLLDRLDAITSEAGGRIYPAKDGRASAAMFSKGYPNLERFRQSIDPSFSSTFWRRSSVPL
jgi:FAD/FMN-containing dehydrogenase